MQQRPVPPRSPVLEHAAVPSAQQRRGRLAEVLPRKQGRVGKSRRQRDQIGPAGLEVAGLADRRRLHRARRPREVRLEVDHFSVTWPAPPGEPLVRHRLPAACLQMAAVQRDVRAERRQADVLEDQAAHQQATIWSGNTARPTSGMNAMSADARPRERRCERCGHDHGREPRGTRRRAPADSRERSGRQSGSAWPTPMRAFGDRDLQQQVHQVHERDPQHQERRPPVPRGRSTRRRAPVPRPHDSRRRRTPDIRPPTDRRRPSAAARAPDTAGTAGRSRP